MSNMPEVTRHGLLDMQVCVPSEFTDEEVICFANAVNPCGTTMGWSIRKQGSKYLKGSDERVPCEERAGFVHVMLDA